MRLIYKGYAVTTYGKSSLSVTDRDGKEIFHTDERDVNTEDELRAYLKEFLRNER